MEIIRVLTVLRQRWRWVVLGVIVAVFVTIASAYKISVLPPKLAKETSLEYGSGTTQLLVDSGASALGRLDQSFEPLMTRAGVYSRMVTSPSVLRYIARESGIRAEQIYAQGPFNPQGTRQSQEPTAERRAGQLAAEGLAYQLRMETEQGVPVININAIAPTAEQAGRLADGAARGLDAYIRDLDRSAANSKFGVDIRQLGPARGVTVNPGVSQQVGVTLGVAVLLGWLLAVVLASNILEDYRLTRRLEAAVASVNGHGSAVPPLPDAESRTPATHA